MVSVSGSESELSRFTLRFSTEARILPCRFVGRNK